MIIIFFYGGHQTQDLLDDKQQTNRAIFIPGEDTIEEIERISPLSPPKSEPQLTNLPPTSDLPPVPPISKPKSSTGTADKKL